MQGLPRRLPEGDRGGKAHRLRARTAAAWRVAIRAGSSWEIPPVQTGGDSPAGLKDLAIDSCPDRIGRMQRRPFSRTLTSWLAILAILMSALAPSISHALGSKFGPSWVEICTPSGAKWVQAGSGTSDEAPASPGGHLLEHCPYCSLHANAIAVPATPVASVPLLLPAHDLPIAFLAAPRTLYAWVSAQPRAPPQFS